MYLERDQGGGGRQGFEGGQRLEERPHPEYEVTADEWKHAYPRTKAAFPLEWLHDSKFWINVARVDNAYGDRNLIPTLCACEI